jgi:hypothetical protein
MIQSLLDVHQGETVSIVGSGPSADLYQGGSGVSIGVNGAARLHQHFSYFLYGDRYAYKRDWFRTDCSDVRVAARIVATMDELIYPKADVRMSVTADNQMMVRGIPDPEPPHKIFNYMRYRPQRLKRTQSSLLFGGTIACCALQLAWIMGASKVIVYGCNFQHSRNSHYFYRSNFTGTVTQSQRDTMQEIINILRNRGLEIHIIGESRLS